MATAATITREEMGNTLRADRGWTAADLPLVKEDVLDWKIPETSITIRVFTSIRKITGISRSVGGDAIRVCALKMWPGGHITGYIKSTRVHRVAGWRDNLIARIKTVMDEANARLATEPKPAPKPEPSTKFEEVVGMLMSAIDKLKWPKITVNVGETTLRLALVTKGKNEGSVNLTDGKGYEDSTWYGAIRPDGSLFKTKKWIDGLNPILDALAADPVKAVKDYGHESGNCVYCSKELTDPRSLMAGYGRVCSANYNLPYPSNADVTAAKKREEAA